MNIMRNEDRQRIHEIAQDIQAYLERQQGQVFAVGQNATVTALETLRNQGNRPINAAINYVRNSTVQDLNRGARNAATTFGRLLRHLAQFDLRAAAQAPHPRQADGALEVPRQVPAAQPQGNAVPEAPRQAGAEIQVPNLRLPGEPQQAQPVGNGLDGQIVPYHQPVQAGNPRLFAEQRQLLFNGRQNLQPLVISRDLRAAIVNGDFHVPPRMTCAVTGNIMMDPARIRQTHAVGNYLDMRRYIQVNNVCPATRVVLNHPAGDPLDRLDDLKEDIRGWVQNQERLLGNNLNEGVRP